jgi:hypothetical protein
LSWIPQPPLGQPPWRTPSPPRQTRPS